MSRSRAQPESGYFSGDVLSWLVRQACGDIAFTLADLLRTVRRRRIADIS